PLYSRAFGASQTDGRTAALAIAIDRTGSAYITGATIDTTLPITPGALPHSPLIFEESDAYVAKVNASGEIVYCTYLGGNNQEYGYGIAVDSGGNAYVTGLTMSGDAPFFPVTSDAIQSHKAAGDDDAFLTKFDP